MLILATALLMQSPTLYDNLSVKLELATAQLELVQLGDPQAALERCDAACATLLASLEQTLSTDDEKKRSQLAEELLDLRASALKAGAVADTTQEDRWTKIAALRPAKPVDAEPTANAAIDEEIMNNALEGNFKFVIQLGQRAVPGLLSALRIDPRNHSSDASKDPLCMLMQVDPIAADAYVGERVAAGELNVFWDIRFSHAIRAAYPFGRAAAWRRDSATQTTLPHMLEQCDRLLSEPQRIDDIGRALRALAQRGECTDAMLAAMERYVDGDQDLPKAVTNWWDYLSDVPKVRAVILRAFASKNPDIAKSARGALMRAATNEGVYGVILAGSKKQRMDGLAWLQSRSGVIVRTNSLELTRQRWTPEYGQAEAHFVNALLKDSDPILRRRVLRELRELKINQQDETLGGWSEYGISEVALTRYPLPIPLPDATLLSLARDESVNVRADLVNAMPYILEQRQLALVVDVMANDPVATISSAALDSLAYLDWDKAPEECIELVGSRPLSFVRREPGSRPPDPMDALLHSQAGLEAAARWAAERNDIRLSSFVAFYNNSPRPQLQALPPELWARLVANVMQVPASHGINLLRVTRMKLAGSRSDPEARSAAVQWAAEDNDLTAYAIYGLLSGSKVPETEELEVAMTQLLKVKKWDPRINVQSSPTATDMLQLMSRYTDSHLERVSQRLMADPDVAPEQISRSFHGFGALPVTAEVIAYAKANADRLRHPGSLVNRVLRTMSYKPELADTSWIQRVTRDAEYAESGFKAMGKLRSAEFLPSLAEVIEGPSNVSYYADAVRALSGYLSDDAAGLLLLAARKTGDEELRAMCLAKVEEIAALQDAEQRWSTRGMAQATREVTVSKLMGLLADSDSAVRVEAIKGLGTWEAVEAMPELIGLLKDSSEEVAAAARATLDLLNAR